MKKHLLLFIIIGSLLLCSWGVVGHKTIAQIAENHLTLQTKNAIKSLLGNQSLADVSSWADQVRQQPEYKNTAPWHFLNVQMGLNYQEFVEAVKSQNNENVYTAVIKCEQQLADENTPTNQKVIALKFIVHLIGGMHQPMHISRAEDRGVNDIQVRYNGQGTNLHALWDSKLLEHEGLAFNQLAINDDTATPGEIRQWQNDDMLKWLYESYQISNQLYTESDNSKYIDDRYYLTYLPVIQQRMEKAGIRLAGVLNQAFKSFKYPTEISSVTTAPPVLNTPNQSSSISIFDVDKHIGEVVTICTKMYGYKFLENMTLVNMGADYPNQLLTVLLKGTVKNVYTNFGSNNICITGKLTEYRGKTEMVVSNLSQIRIASK